jgi:hypothetical protein
MQYNNRSSVSKNTNRFSTILCENCTSSRRQQPPQVKLTPVCASASLRSPDPACTLWALSRHLSVDDEAECFGSVKLTLLHMLFRLAQNLNKNDWCCFSKMIPFITRR